MGKVKHGGNIYEYAGKLIDFSSNINPLGIPESGLQVLQDGWEHLERYPDLKYRELRQVIGTYHGLSLENVVVGNGAAEIIFLLGQLFYDKKILIPMPTFGEYQLAVELASGQVITVQREAEQGFALPMDKILACLPEVDGLLICHPNNPTGGLTPQWELAELIEQTHKLGKMLILDEAFIDFSAQGEEMSGLKWLKTGKYPGLFIIRAYTKFYAVPGLRLGYGLGDPQLISRLQERQMPWSVNSLAEAMGKVLLDDLDYRQRSQEWIATEREDLLQALVKIPEIQVFPTDADFILCQIRDGLLTAAELQEKLVLRGILIRDASSFEGLDSSYFRVAIKGHDQNRRLVHELIEVFGCL